MKWGRIFLSILATIGAAALLREAYFTGRRHWEDRPRDDRLIAAFRNSAGTPFQWKAKEVIYDYLQVRRALLVRRDFMCTDAEIREQLKTLEQELEIGKNWRGPKISAPLPRVQQLEPDGMPSQDFWTGHALNWRGEYELNQTSLHRNSAIWQLGYDADFLYFQAEFPDSSEQMDDRKTLYQQDCFELFILPEERYFTYVELVLSRDGKAYTQWVTQTPRSRYELFDYHPASLSFLVSSGHDSWKIRGKIGFRDLPGYLRGNPAKPGETIRFMMLRFDRNQDGKIRKWTPVPFLYDGHNYFGYAKLTLQ